MSKTKRIQLFYRITHTEIRAPNAVALERKEEWIKNIQQEVPSPTKENPEPSKIVRLTYEQFDPEVENQIRFFNGPVVEYYAIQNEDMLEGRPESDLIKRYREQLLDDALGYDLPLVDRTVRRRESTGAFLSTQKWHDFLETLKENHFDPSGYEFPDSDRFWEIAAASGEENAREIVIKQLQGILKKKLSTPPTSA